MSKPMSVAEPAASETAQPKEFQTAQVLTVVGGHFVHDTYSAFLAPLLPLIQEKLSLSYSLVGGLALFMQLPGIINPFIGYLADRLSVRYFVIFAPAPARGGCCGRDARREGPGDVSKAAIGRRWGVDQRDVCDHDFRQARALAPCSNTAGRVHPRGDAGVDGSHEVPARLDRAHRREPQVKL